MKANIRKSICRTTVRFATAIFLLVFSMGVMVAPPVGFSQNVPPVGDPSVQCPHCKKWFVCRGAKVPDVCPLCHQPMFEKPGTATPSTGARPAQPNPLSPLGTMQKSPNLQTIDPFDDYLFYGVPIRPDDGKLQTRHFDPDGDAARAEAWGERMKEINEENRKKWAAQAEKDKKAKDAILKKPGGSGADATPAQPLQNPFADDASVVDLRGSQTLTPKLLRDPDADAGGAPVVAKQKLSERPLDTLTDQELDQRSAGNDQEIQRCVTMAKYDLDTTLREQKVWTGTGDDLTQGRTDLIKATADATIGFSAVSLGEKAEDTGHDNVAKTIKTADYLKTMPDDIPETAHASAKGETLKGVGYAGDAVIGPASDFLVDVTKNLPAESELILHKETASAMGVGFTSAKFGIDYSAAWWTLGINGKLINQFDAQNARRSDEIYNRGERMKALEADQKLIQAEKDRRNRMNGAVTPNE
jgi:hypothetical protein